MVVTSWVKATIHDERLIQPTLMIPSLSSIHRYTASYPGHFLDSGCRSG